MNRVSIGSVNSFSPGRRQSIIWINAGVISIRTLLTNGSEIVSKIQTSSFKKMHLQILIGNWQSRLRCVKYQSKSCVLTWLRHPRYWPFVRGIHRSPVNSPHIDQWRRALTFSLICAWINGWVKDREADDLRRHRADYDATVKPNYWLIFPEDEPVLRNVSSGFAGLRNEPEVESFFFIQIQIPIQTIFIAS